MLFRSRFVSEELGAKVSWDGQKKQVTIADGETTVVLTVGQKEMQVNGNKKTLDTAASVKDTRTYVPLRFVSEALGAVVEWDSKGKSVYINNNGKPILKDEIQVVERSGFSWVLQEGDEFKEKQGYDGIGVLTAAKFRAVFYEGKTNKLVLGLQTSRGYSQTGDCDKQCEELRELLEQRINATCVNQVIAYEIGRAHV